MTFEELKSQEIRINALALSVREMAEEFGLSVCFESFLCKGHITTDVLFYTDDGLAYKLENLFETREFFHKEWIDYTEKKGEQE